jgi:hypothetical protein
MREKDFNTGLRGTLFEARHYARMGAAVWLYGWLVLRQTHESAGIGYVLGGSPLTYREIQEETGFNERTLETWMRVLRREGYIATRKAPGGISIQILKAKKHRGRQVGTPPGNQSAQHSRTNHAQSACAVSTIDGSRKPAGTPRESAGVSPQSRVPNRTEFDAGQQFARPISSSSVEESIEIPNQNIHSRVQNRDCASQSQPQDRFAAPVFDRNEAQQDSNPSCLEQIKSHLREQNYTATTGSNQGSDRHADTYSPFVATRPNASRQAELKPYHETAKTFSWELRKRMQLLRAEREEETRRELYVGTGPEGRHS